MERWATSFRLFHADGEGMLDNAMNVDGCVPFKRL
jgi:hypothetical protein